MNALLLKVFHLSFGLVNLLLVQTRPICSRQIFPFACFLAALDPMLKRFTKTFLTHEEEGLQCPLTKLNLKFFL
jgi:hypothetical protein